MNLPDTVKLARAKGLFVHQRPTEWIDIRTGKTVLFDDARLATNTRGRFKPAYRNASGKLVKGRRWIVCPKTLAEIPDPRDVTTLWTEESKNVKTTVGIDFLFAQGYSTSTGANGLNYIALSNDSLTETSASTTLSTEIATNGLTRAQGTYAHTTAASTATIAKTFTCATSSQACQKAALFTASSVGTMNHALAFTQRTLQVGDTIAVTFTITIS